jgi:cytochrome c553
MLVLLRDEAAMFVLPTEGICAVCHEMVSYGMIYIPSFVKIGAGLQAILRSVSAILEAVMLVLLRDEAPMFVLQTKGICAVCHEMASYGKIYIPSFMKIGAGLQKLLRFCLSNLRGCNVGIIEG